MSTRPFDENIKGTHCPLLFVTVFLARTKTIGRVNFASLTFLGMFSARSNKIAMFFRRFVDDQIIFDDIEKKKGLI